RSRQCNRLTGTTFVYVCFFSNLGRLICFSVGPPLVPTDPYSFLWCRSARRRSRRPPCSRRCRDRLGRGTSSAALRNICFLCNALGLIFSLVRSPLFLADPHRLLLCKYRSGQSGKRKQRRSDYHSEPNSHGRLLINNLTV